MINYVIERIPCLQAKDYIKANHYSRGCHNRPSPCYGLFDSGRLIGVIAFATPCSERVRASVFGEALKGTVTELHRLHILDGTPKNTESWFISRALKLLKADKPEIYAVITFSDTSEGHTGVIYRATNAYAIGTTGRIAFYRDGAGRLRHPRQCGVNISAAKAKELGWQREIRAAKYRFLYLLAASKREKKELIRLCKYRLQV